MAGTEIATTLHELVDRDLTFMHICGTHEAAIARAGLRSVLPEQLKIVMGPGCPVCITPQGEIDAALELVERGCIVATYGDLLRVPGTKGSLESSGGDVRIVQGVHKAVEIAQKTDRDVVFISVGFETTAPTVAAMILAQPPANFSILSCHRIVPPAPRARSPRPYQSISTDLRPPTLAEPISASLPPVTYHKPLAKSTRMRHRRCRILPAMTRSIIRDTPSSTILRSALPQRTLRLCDERFAARCLPNQSTVRFITSHVYRGVDQANGCPPDG